MVNFSPKTPAPYIKRAQAKGSYPFKVNISSDTIHLQFAFISIHVKIDNVNTRHCAAFSWERMFDDCLEPPRGQDDK